MADDRRLFEKLSLEGFQSGLSWRTILAKRENFRAAFHGFELERVARFTEADVARLLQDAGIVRHRGKIEAVINNARQGTRGRRARGLAGGLPLASRARPEPRRRTADRVGVARGGRLSKALKKQGWKFVGPTTVYAFMQAMGLVNDHVAECAIRRDVEDARARFTPPTG